LEEVVRTIALSLCRREVGHSRHGLQIHAGGRQDQGFDESSIAIPYDGEYSGFMSSKADVWQGTLALMVLKTLERTGPLHGYGIARQIEQTSTDLLSVNYGTLYPALLKLEQEGYISSEWGFSDSNRKAKFYELTRAGRKQIETETQEWEQMAAILARFLNPKIA
jgi:transcriptional regulator